MKFYTAFSEGRPIRLSEKTRAFAWESMQGRYGDDTMRTPYVDMRDIEGFAHMTPQEKYDAAVMKIAKEAPIRICENETVSGAATLGAAIRHVVPAYFDSQPVAPSISHLTIDFPTVVFKGINYLEAQLCGRLRDTITDDQRIQLEGMKNVIAAMHVFHQRYLDALRDRKPEHYAILKNVPFCAAASFKEAVQSLWFTFAFVRLCGNWPGLGRMDEMLGGFLKKDLENGAITYEEAREYLAGMFIKGCEWIQSDTPKASGDAQHYQNIVLGGISEDGTEVTNEVTYLALDIVEELGISDFPITVRVNLNTPEKLLTRVSEVMRHGGGVIAVYNEALIIQSLTDFGYDKKEARRFANDGCWEVQIPGKTYFIYTPIDSLQILLNRTLKLNSDSPAAYHSFDALYESFYENLKNCVEEMYRHTVEEFFATAADGTLQWKTRMPCSVVSLFEEGCIQTGRNYCSGGPVYITKSLHIGGAPDVGNSLYAIDRLVFKEKKVSFSQLTQILKNNWEGAERLRQYVSNRLTFYGNDNDESDAYTVRVLNDFAHLVEKLNGRCPICFPSGVSTFGREIEWAQNRAAVPFGRRGGDILSSNASPTPNTDFQGATAVISSYCKADLLKQTCGAALDLKLCPSTVSGANGVEALKGLIRGFVSLGGFFMQIDVVDREILRKAQENPQDYKTLSVRVSGWNARFVTLDEQWQQMIIDRTEQEV